MIGPVLAVLSLASDVAPPAPDDSFWLFPPEAVAWVAVDAPVFHGGAAESQWEDPLGTLIDAGVQAAAFDLAPWPAGSLGPPRAVLRTLTDGPWPWRACLIEIEATPARLPPADRPGVRPTRIAAAIEVRAPAAEHESLRARVRAALALDPAAALDRVEIDAAPGDGPIAWSPVACRSHGDAFIVSFGEGVIDRWPSPADAEAPWSAHAVAMAEQRGRPVIAAFADLNALRRAMPDAFGSTRFRRTLRAFSLANAREAMLRARLVEPADVTLVGAEGDYVGAPLLAIDAAWSPRSEPPGTIRAVAITRAEWPATVPGLEARPPAEGGGSGARYALAARAAWVNWVSLVLNTWLGAGDDWDETARTARLTRWHRTHADTLGRVLRAGGDWAVAWAPADRPAILFAAPCAADARTQADHRIIFGSIHDAVSFDQPSRSWSVDLPSPPLRLRWTAAAGGAGGGGIVAELRNP